MKKTLLCLVMLLMLVLASASCGSEYNTPTTSPSATSTPAANTTGTSASTTSTSATTSMHKHVEQIIPSIPATCSEDGKTQGKKCADCGEILVAQQTVPAKGHTWSNNVCTICKTPRATDGLNFTLINDGTEYEVSGIGTATDTDIVIPSTYNGKPVTSIGNNAFDRCKSLTSIIIPDSVTIIGKNAFRECNNLTSVTLGNSVTTIGDGAFSRCSSLTSIIIPDSVTSIGDEAFHSCAALASVKIGNGVTSIGRNVLSCCYSLTSITIPDSVTNIVHHAFSDSGFISVTIPNSVTSIESDAFRGCANLTSIYFTGTKAEWNAIEKGVYWNAYTGNYTVHCSDGDIAK